MDTKSQQLMLDMWTNEDVDSLVPQICLYITEKFTVLQKSNYKFSPQGETVVFVLSESHFALHTYPERKYLSIDIYICNMSVDLKQVAEEISQICKPVKVNQRIMTRGFDEGITDRQD